MVLTGVPGRDMLSIITCEARQSGLDSASASVAASSFEYMTAV